ncbi:MAG: ATP-dependent DNA helicase RecG [candidate division WOR-3 bacterium]
MVKNNLFDSIKYLKGVGPKMAEILNQMGIYTKYDLLTYPPFRYIDRNIIEEDKIEDGDYITIFAQVIDCGEIFTRKGKYIFQALAKTKKENYFFLTWFNNRFIKNSIKKGDVALFSGKVRIKRGGFEILHPDFEIFQDDFFELINTGKIVPVYHTRSNITQKYLRKLVFNLLKDIDQIDEDLPSDLLIQKNLIDLTKAIKNLHFPENEEKKEESLRRLKYGELFYAGLLVAKRKIENRERRVEKNYLLNSSLVDRFLSSLDFRLTDDQKKVINEILNDLKSDKPMNRLLMGDVGVGKTVVATIAMLYAVDSGYQAALMAPTEILAQQHYLKIKNWVENLGVDVELLTSSITENKRRYDQIKNGDIKIVIGTHALIGEDVVFKNLKFVIVDEQHRFGVIHRSSLKEKGIDVDYLVMTATPIPRSLSLAIYGDMDLSEIRQRPSMQKEIKTKWVSPEGIVKMYEFIRKRIDNKERVFIVCPAIEGGEEADYESVKKVYENLSKTYLKGYKLGIIHSKLSPKDREKVMNELKEGVIDVLVGTTIIEVGIDIKDATVMVILSAERFGLSQLHQLRGRVGRGDKQSFCFVVSSEDITDDAKKRLQVFSKYNDGFKISEYDLKLRGPGEIWGRKQSGIPMFKFANFFDDFDLMKEAFKDAENFLYSDMNLLKKENRVIKINLERRLNEKVD